MGTKMNTIDWSGLDLNVNTPIVADAAALTLNASQSGSLVYVDTATAVAITLPTAAAGLRFRIAIGVTNTTGNHVISCGSGDLFQGGLAHVTSGTGQVGYYAPDTTADNTITLNSGTTGGEIGTYIDVYAVDATNWFVTGIVLGAGNTPATPFSTV